MQIKFTFIFRDSMQICAMRDRWCGWWVVGGGWRWAGQKGAWSCLSLPLHAQHVYSHLIRTFWHLC